MYPKIEEKFRQIITDLLLEYSKKSKDLINDYIESLASHVSDANPMFANAVDVESRKIRDRRVCLWVFKHLKAQINNNIQNKLIGTDVSIRLSGY